LNETERSISEAKQFLEIVNTDCKDCRYLEIIQKKGKYGEVEKAWYRCHNASKCKVFSRWRLGKVRQRVCLTFIIWEENFYIFQEDGDMHSKRIYPKDL
jgi:ssDNA-binding Zn-finger/Zn-ribbon topoisomerase 1